MAHRKDPPGLHDNQESELIESILEIIDEEMSISETKLGQKHESDSAAALVADILDSLAVDSPKK